MPTVWYTPQAARRTAQRLEPVARELCRRYRQLLESPARPVEEGPVEHAYFRQLGYFHSAAGRLREAGVVVQDLAEGWFEFPSRRAGRDVRLCWRLGAPAPCGWSERAGSRSLRLIDAAGPWDDPAAP